MGDEGLQLRDLPVVWAKWTEGFHARRQRPRTVEREMPGLLTFIATQSALVPENFPLVKGMISQVVETCYKLY